MSQWRRVEYAANNRMTPEARAEVLEALHSGKISAVKNLRLGSKRAFGVTNAFTNRTQINEDAFEELSIGDFAGLLAHEMAHTGHEFRSHQKADALADAYMCANTWPAGVAGGGGRDRFQAGAYRRVYGPCGSGVK